MPVQYLPLLYSTQAGSQFGKLIDRRVRELNVASVVISLNTPIEELKKYKALIISGGPGTLLPFCSFLSKLLMIGSVYAEDSPKFDKNLFNTSIPLLGICYGAQLMASVHGGTVERILVLLSTGAGAKNED